MQFIVLSSSRGTTFQAVIDRMKDGSLGAQCRGLITDRSDRGCVEKARAAGIPVEIVEHVKGEERSVFGKRLLDAMKKLGARPGTTVVAALGWMWILDSVFVRAYPVINVHPALLPKYGGEGMFGARVHEAVLAAGDRQSGVSIHLMDDGVDTGKILLQKTCPIFPDDTAVTLQARVQELEKEWYPRVLEMIESGEMRLV